MNTQYVPVHARETLWLAAAMFPQYVYRLTYIGNGAYFVDVSRRR